MWCVPLTRKLQCRPRSVPTNTLTGQQISEPRGPSIKIDKMWDCLIKMLKTPGPNDPRAKPKPSKSIFLFVVLIRSSLISAESNQHPAPDNIYWGQHYISWLGGEIVAICTTDMQQCKINHCNGRQKWKSLSVERNMMLAWERSRQWSNRIFWKYAVSILSEPGHTQTKGWHTQTLRSPSFLIR